jgi:hypothetical protein
VRFLILALLLSGISAEAQQKKKKPRPPPVNAIFAHIDKDIAERQKQQEADLAEAKRRGITLNELHTERLAESKAKLTVQLYGEETGRKILAGEVWVGMTKEQASFSRGEPNEINKTTLSDNSTKEQWVYGLGDYLYFENEILTGIQERTKK